MIKAIETTYKGYRFRSRLEARWAVFLDHMNVEWEYEKEGYELPSGRYLPDFFLPRLNCWLEIKGTVPTELEIQKCAELYFHTDIGCAITWGLPKPPEMYKGNYIISGLSIFCFDSTDNSGGETWWEDCFWAKDKKGETCICSNNSWSSRVFNTRGIIQLQDISRPISQREADVAKSARFEHKEKQVKRKLDPNDLAYFVDIPKPDGTYKGIAYIYDEDKDVRIFTAIDLLKDDKDIVAVSEHEGSLTIWTHNPIGRDGIEIPEILEGMNVSDYWGIEERKV